MPRTQLSLTTCCKDGRTRLRGTTVTVLQHAVLSRAPGTQGWTGTAHACGAWAGRPALSCSRRPTTRWPAPRACTPRGRPRASTALTTRPRRATLRAGAPALPVAVSILGREPVAVQGFALRQHRWCRQGASQAASKCACVRLLLLVAWRATATAAHTAHAGQGAGHGTARQVTGRLSCSMDV